MKKYELTEETLTVSEKTLYRIRAVRDFGFVKTGEFGGYIEKEENLSHFGNAWIPAMQRFTAMQEFPAMRGFTATQKFSIRGISLYKDRSGAGMDTLHFTGLRMIR